MSGVHDGKPENVSTFSLTDGGTAAYISREKKHFSNLHNGYPLAEEFLDDLRSQGVDTIVIDSSDGIYVFDVLQYQRGDRLGHAPYPMKRVVSIDDAESASDERRKDTPGLISEWEWVTDSELQPKHDQPRDVDSSDPVLQGN